MLKKVLIMVLIFGAGLAVGVLSGRFWPGSGQEDIKWLGAGQGEKVLSLSGTALEVKPQSVIIKSRVLSGENLLVVTKEALVSEATVIYALTPKEQADFYGEPYGSKLEDLRQALRNAQMKEDEVSVKKVVEQIRALSLEANEAKNATVRSLEQKLSSLPDNSSERVDLMRQLTELSSEFKYTKIKVSDISPNASIEVWSDEDLGVADKFTATKIEVRQ